jgi:hypothetical protein
VALIVSVVASAARDRKESMREDALPAPEARQTALLDELRELEFDYETGVVTEEEYRRLRPELARRAVAAHEEVATTGGRTSADAGVGSGGGEPAGGREPGSCVSCGASVRSGASFCGHCGAPVGGAREDGPSREAGEGE